MAKSIIGPRTGGNIMTLLCDLALKYGTDKCSQIKHHYTELYYELLNARRMQVKKVVEIGIDQGASLRMWRDFFPNAQIYGADIRPEALIQEERITSLLCDQTSKKDLKSLIDATGNDIDLFIDDGTHNPDDQIFTCLAAMSLLNKSVLYVIEDVGKPEIINRLNKYDCQISRFRHKQYWDDRLLIVRHPEKA